METFHNISMEACGTAASQHKLSIRHQRTKVYVTMIEIPITNNSGDLQIPRL